MKKIFFGMIAAIMFLHTGIACAVELETKTDNGNLFDLKYIKNFLGKENIDFLIENGIEIEEVNMPLQVQSKLREQGINVNDAYKDIVNSIRMDAVTYSLSQKQVENYINASMKSVPIIGLGKGEVDKVRDEIKAENRPPDDGIGWEVQSLSAYSGATTFLTLPTIQNRTNGTAAYMFYTVGTRASTNVSNWNMDFGLGYDMGGDGTVKWRVFQVRTDSNFNASEDMYEPFANVNIDTNNLYFKVEHMTGSNTGYMKFQILDGNNFDKVFVTYHFYVGSFGVYDTNTSFNKQVTLCNVNSNFLTGTKLLGASFSESYIYSTPNSMNSRMLPKNCEDGEYVNGVQEPDRCGSFGTNDVNVRQVVKNSGTNWYKENISIYFQNM